MKRLILFSVEKRDNLILKPFALVLTTGDYFRTLSTSSFAEFQANRSMSRERQEGVHAYRDQIARGVTVRFL